MKTGTMTILIGFGMIAAAATGAVAGHVSARRMLQGEGLDALTVERLNVKRINVREENGSYALVIANSQNLPGPNPQDTQDKSRRGIPGILFYDPLGEEIGGLIFPARPKDGTFAGGIQLSMDQVRQRGGEAIALRTWRDGDFVRSGLEIVDYATDKSIREAARDPEIRALLQKAKELPEEERERFFQETYLPALGRKGYLTHRILLMTEGAHRRAAKLELRDSLSRPRIRLIVDENDVPRIELLDENGRIIRAIGGSASDHLLE